MSAISLSPVEQARRNQTTAADPRLSIFVRANAGSGKTTTLVARVARLLLQRVAPGEILCVTYTKAAAAEMQSRLFQKLGEWAVASDAALRQSLSELDNSDPNALTEQDLSDARRLFARALETPGGLKIQTIHAFCEKLLRRFPIEAGVTPGFEVLEDQAAEALSRDARKVLAQYALRNADSEVGRAYAHFAVNLDFKSFNSLLGAIEARRNELKACEEARHTDHTLAPWHIVGLEADLSPQDVEAEFLNRIDPAEWRRMADLQETGGGANDIKMAERMRAAVPPDTALSAMYSIFYDTKGQIRKKFGGAKVAAEAKLYLENLAIAYEAALGRLRAARVAQNTHYLLELAKVHAFIYEQAKSAVGGLDFTDLVGKTLDLLVHRTDAAWVLFKLDGGIEHILIDEAQDTAPEQWDIMRALTDSFYAGEGVERDRAIARSVFAVGDEKQSIYSFQGARPERLLQESQRYSAHAHAVGADFRNVDLGTSFRSTPDVLSFVDRVFNDPERARALNGDEGDTITHEAARQGQRGLVEIWPLFRDPPTEEKKPWTAPVDQESEASANKQLARALAREIREQVANAAPVYNRDGTTRGATYGDYLILVRRRKALFEEIIRALKMEGVPVAGADRLKLNEHIVYDDMLALGRFAQFPDDDLSLAEILRSPFCRIPDFGADHDLFHLADAKTREGRKLWRVLRERRSEHPQWEEAASFLETLLAVRDGDPFTFFTTALNHLFADGRSGRARILDRLGRETEEALDETLNQILAAEERGGRDLESCLHQLEQSAVEVKREMEGARNEVRVMTVHGSKGLEAPIVILPDTTSPVKGMGLPLIAREKDNTVQWLFCPTSAKEDCPASAEFREMREARAREEGLRLLYVALTRAKDRVIIMGRALKTDAAMQGSWWQILDETFTAAVDSGLAKEGEDGRRYYGQMPPPADKAAPADKTEAAILPDWAHSRPAADMSARFAAPSRMEDGKTVKRIPAPSPLATAPTGGAALGRFRRGDLIHRLLERLPDIAPAMRRTLAVKMLSKEVDLDDEQRAEMIEAAFSVLDDARFAPVFGPGSRAEVALTGTAPELPAGVKINGQIDR
uniref:double-strand break repair helicase AddA n=1 Tax=uncultured Brevundimonas sp. TaxID=213418 RepID=UPI0026396A40